MENCYDNTCYVHIETCCSLRNCVYLNPGDQLRTLSRQILLELLPVIIQVNLRTLNYTCISRYKCTLHAISCPSDQMLKIDYMKLCLHSMQGQL